jgi:hypothetical protein
MACGPQKSVTSNGPRSSSAEQPRCISAVLKKPSVHPDAIRALRTLRRQFPDSGYVFATERGGPFTTDAANRLIKRIGARAGFAFPVHAQAAHLLSGILVGTFCCSRGTTRVSLCASPCALTPPRWPSHPLFAGVERSLPLTQTRAISSCAYQTKKNPTPLRGAHLAADDSDQKH